MEECPLGKTVHPNTRLNEKRKSSKTSHIYVPFFLNLSIYHLLNPSLHLISIDLLKVSEVKVT